MNWLFLRTRPCIVLLGDSLTQLGFGDVGTGVAVGWAGHLATLYSRRCDVLNRGFSGYNSRHILDLLPSLFPPQHTGSDNDGYIQQVEPAFCTVWLGANDAALPGEPQHVPLNEYAQNIDSIVVGLRERLGPTVPIFLLTPPPVDAVKWMNYRERQTPDRDNEVARTYGLEVMKIAERHSKCAAVDTWVALSGATEQRSTFLVDGLHLNEAGNRIVFEALMKTIREQFPEVAPAPENDAAAEADACQEGIPLEGKPWRELCGGTEAETG
jgi:isoamyl acetate esterase